MLCSKFNLLLTKIGFCEFLKLLKKRANVPVLYILVQGLWPNFAKIIGENSYFSDTHFLILCNQN